MSKKTEILREQLLAQMTDQLDALLEKRGDRRDMSMSEMEDLVGKLQADLMQQLMQTLIQENQAETNGLCPDCGGKLRYKGKKPKQVITVRGEVTVDRDYYKCEACESGYFPPGPPTELELDRLQ